MGSKERRDRERDETRGRILDAAREMFVSDGVEAVTMRAIARRIEYTPTAIYHHFKDKNALIIELCHGDFRALAHAFGKVGRIDDPVERLRRIGQAYVEFAIEYPSHYRFMFMTITPPFEPIGDDRGNPEEDAYAFLKMSVEEAISARTLRPELDNADLVAQMLWASTHGVVSLHIAKEHDSWISWQDTRKTAHQAIDAMLRGIVRDDA